LTTKQTQKTITKRTKSNLITNRRVVYFSDRILNTKELTEDKNYFMYKKNLKKTTKDRPFYIFDLSDDLSKYIGETEKNLNKIFERTKNMNEILIFDEVDALFGKRSKVKNFYDKYADLETSYLLKKIEKYKRIIFISSNFKKLITKQSIVKLDYIVCFPIKKRKIK